MEGIRPVSEKILNVEPFDKLSNFFAANGDFGQQKLVMENLKFSGFQMLPRADTFNDSHIDLLLKTFEKFHGISAAHREHNPIEYKAFMDLLKNCTATLLEMNIMAKYILYCIRELTSSINDLQIKDSLKKYCENGIQIAKDSLKYNGKNPVFCHRDC